MKKIDITTEDFYRILGQKEVEIDAQNRIIAAMEAELESIRRTKNDQNSEGEKGQGAQGYAVSGGEAARHGR
jgi:hypothetical protein